MSVGGESVDAVSLYVDGKCAEPLDGVDEEETIVAGADCAELFEICAIAAKILHVADGQHPGTFACLVDAVQLVEDGEPADFDPAGFEAFPGIQVGGEFFFEGYYDVAGFPCDSHGYCGDSFGRVFYYGDFCGFRVY